MPRTYTTDELAQLVDTAAEAVRQLVSHDSADSNEEWLAASRVAREAVGAAVEVPAVTAAQIAAAAGVRQLMVADLITDPGQRITALVNARLDAARYHDQVMATIRTDVHRLWSGATSEGEEALPRGWKTMMCGVYAISRTTLDEWIADWQQNLKEESDS